MHVLFENLCSTINMVQADGQDFRNVPCPVIPYFFFRVNLWETLRSTLRSTCRLTRNFFTHARGAVLNRSAVICVYFKISIGINQNDFEACIMQISGGVFSS